jgi:hypothetical protein
MYPDWVDVMPDGIAREPGIRWTQRNQIGIDMRDADAPAFRIPSSLSPCKRIRMSEGGARSVPQKESSVEFICLDRTGEICLEVVNLRYLNLMQGGGNIEGLTIFRLETGWPSLDGMFFGKGPSESGRNTS